MDANAPAPSTPDAARPFGRLEFSLARSGKRPLARGIQAYGVVRGRATRAQVAQPPGDAPHYHVLVETDDGHAFDVAINVFSQEGSEVLYRIDTNISPPEASSWLALPGGATTIGPAGAGGIGVDYLRQLRLTRDQFQLLPVASGRVNDLHDALSDFVGRAIADPSAEVFAFGKLFGAASSGRPNPVFGTSPDLGIHDIHMNQGNPAGRFGGSNGVYEDGAVFVYYPGDGHWEAALIAFQSQAFQTSDANGNPVG